jgi:predicted RNA-binding Zn ribbon-like protein
MKKQSKPTGLIISLVLILAMAFGFNAYQSGLLDSLAPKPTAAAPTESTTTAESIGKTTNNLVSAAIADEKPKEKDKETFLAEADAKKKNIERKMNPATGGLPLMATPKQTMAKPVPSDSSISTQWYTNKTRKPN